MGVCHDGGTVIVSMWILACTPPAPEPDRDPSSPSETGTTDSGNPSTPTGATGHTAATGDTAGAPSPIDCSLLVPVADITYHSLPAITTEEDFDFDGQGYLLTQHEHGLQGLDHGGGVHFVAADVGGDATGIRSTSEGDVVVAQPTSGSVWRVDRTTGGSVPIVADLDNPNGIEAGEDGRIYVTENTPDGRVRSVDATTGDFDILVQANYANGIVLSPDEQTLYFTSSSSPFGGPTRIVSLARDPSGEWDPSSMAVIYTHPEYVGSITIDACGNLYGVEFVYGRVFRIDTATLVAEPVVQISGFGAFSALHFSPGLGGWDAKSLVVSSRYEVFEVPTGVPGSHVLTP